MEQFNTKEHLQSINTKNILPKKIIVFSHLRWDFVYQRPQHILTRLAAKFEIIFIEEPLFDTPGNAYYSANNRNENITVLVPHLSGGLNEDAVNSSLSSLFDDFIESEQPENCIFWFYTPMSLQFTGQHTPVLTIYDCMDELSAFKFAPDNLKQLERQLLSQSDLVFTGGNSLYQAKKHQHPNIYSFPSAIDKEHFFPVRSNVCSKNHPGNPVLGFYGVIDERFDAQLIKDIADARPDWQIEIIGPVVKIDPASLPKNDNIKYWGSISYRDLPKHIAPWDIALIPFLLNESTRFISPTKTPEYLAAGLPVVSTSLTDVITPYAIEELVSIADDGYEFVKAAEAILTIPQDEKEAWLERVDSFLSNISWDDTAMEMLSLIKRTWREKQEEEALVPVTSNQQLVQNQLN